MEETMDEVQNDFNPVVAGPNQKAVFEFLQAQHAVGDRSVLTRQQEILMLCSSRDYTIDEMAEHFEMNYYTIYKNVRELQLLGLLVPLAKKRERKHCFVTNWNIVRETGEELAFRDHEGNYIPISAYIARFLGPGGEKAKWMINHMGELLISNHVNKKLRARGEPNYGETHEEMIQKELLLILDFFKNMLEIIHQAAMSPILTDDRGFEMYALPKFEDEDIPLHIHDRIESRFHEQGYYDEM